MIELVIGGARSGKSSYALSHAVSKDRDCYFVATARPGDDEMAARITRHKQQRGQQWKLVEEPMFLAGVVENFGNSDVVIVDCLTMWLTNWLCSNDREGWEPERKRFLDSLKVSDADWLLVSNETGLGIIPEGELNRRFVDQSGWLHQDVARLADRVTLLVCGIPQLIKSEKI
jgi:adenosylcobinamide kinase/adenosylcobinamide-phosphate guanylyltransferase